MPSLGAELTAEESALVSASDVDGLLASHIASCFGAQRQAEARSRFALEHVAVLRGLCPPGLLPAIRQEACSIVERFGTTHSLVFEITDGTPRNMTTVGQPVIKAEGPLIDAFYFAPTLTAFMEQIVGERVYTCPYPGEHYVISRLGRSGDTHGWHWDDYTYGVILVLESPPYTEGGFIQAVPHTSWDKQNPDVHGALISSQVHSYALEPGDVYVVKTNTTMHRVYPIRGESRRTIVNMTLASTADLSRPMTHETNDVLFGGVTDPRGGA
jgi:hypothetical protein